jgi:NAD(P)H dehydrogenase (quinone)
MRALIVLAHPEPKSFNAYLARVAKSTLEEMGYTVETTDLYALDFDPRESPLHFSCRLDSTRFQTQREQKHAVDTDTVPPDVQGEIGKIERSNVLIVQYPMWWFGMPAILKGWVDRTFLYGKMYTRRRRYDRGPCAGKRALVSITLGAPEGTYAHDGRNADIDLLLWPTLFTFYYVGFSVLKPFITYDVDAATAAQSEDSADRYRSRLKSLENSAPIPFNRFDEWDSDGRLKPAAPVFSPFVRRRPVLAFD